MDALSLSAVEESQTTTAAEAAGAEHAARWFFIAAALIALADIVIAPWLTHELPNALVVAALILALAGVAADLAAGMPRVASARSRLPERALASEGWSAFAV